MKELQYFFLAAPYFCLNQEKASGEDSGLKKQRIKP